MKPDSGRGLINGSATAVFNDPVGATLHAIGGHGSKQQLGAWANQDFNASTGEFVPSRDQDHRHKLVWFKEHS